MSPTQTRTASRRNGHKPKKTATLLAQRIVGEIADGHLAPGTPLESEKEMLERYQLARGTLREALRFLEIQGVIQIKTGPGGGPIVAEPSSRHLASNLAMVLQLEGAPFAAVLDARTTLEPTLAARAAENITEEQLAELQASMDRMGEHIEDPSIFLEENENFHAIIAQASNNAVFANVMSALHWIIDGTRLGVEYETEQRKSVLREHKRIYERVAAGDAEGSRAAMASHIEDFAKFLARRYPAVVDAPIRWDQID